MALYLFYLYVGITSIPIPLCSFCYSSDSSPKSGSSSAVWFLRVVRTCKPVCWESVACIYSHNPFTCLTISLCVCLFFPFAVSSCASLPPAIAHPPFLPPSSLIRSQTLLFRRKHTHTGTCCASLDQSLWLQYVFRRGSFILHSLEHNSESSLFFAVVQGLLEFHPFRNHYDPRVHFN